MKPIHAVSVSCAFCVLLVAGCGGSSGAASGGGGGGGGGSGKKGIGGTPVPGFVFAANKLSFAGGSHALAAVDADGDGDLDLFLGNAAAGTGAANELYVNDGDGGFTKAALPQNAESTSSIAVGDLDGDKIPDLVCGNGLFDDAQGGGISHVYLNDGKGGYRSAPLPGSRLHTQSVALGDVDGDGDLDIVTGNGLAGVSAEPNRLYLNDGTGTFSLKGTIGASPRATMAVALADVDGDGDLDLVAGNQVATSGGANRLFAGDGTGSFAEISGAFPGAVDKTLAVAVGDVDADGDADVVFGNEGQDSLYLGDGKGTFVDATAKLPPAATAGTEAIALVDYDEDGDLDIVASFVERGPQADTFGRVLWLGDGSGTFAPTTAPLLPDSAFEGASLFAADIDGDRDPDLVLGGSTVHFYRNPLRDIASTQPPKLGGTWPVTVRAKPGLAPAGQIHVPYLALAPLYPRVPLAEFGAWGLNPSVQINLPVVPVPSPAGEFEMLIPVPADPVLDGRNLYMQSLAIHEVTKLSAWHLTNVHSGKIER